jgi:hypothetical protein
MWNSNGRFVMNINIPTDVSELTDTKNTIQVDIRKQAKCGFTSHTKEHLCQCK